jgi:hypothetical protein
MKAYAGEPSLESRMGEPQALPGWHRKSEAGGNRAWLLLFRARPRLGQASLGPKVQRSWVAHFGPAFSPSYRSPREGPK